MVMQKLQRLLSATNTRADLSCNVLQPGQYVQPS